MMKSEDEGKNVPEWDFFGRIDELETIALKIMEQTDKAEPTLKEIQSILRDYGILVRAALQMAFAGWARDVQPKDVRMVKDIWLDHLKKQDLGSISFEWADDMMTKICERKEKKYTNERP